MNLRARFPTPNRKFLWKRQFVDHYSENWRRVVNAKPIFIHVIYEVLWFLSLSREWNSYTGLNQNKKKPYASPWQLLIPLMCESHEKDKQIAFLSNKKQSKIKQFKPWIWFVDNNLIKIHPLNSKSLHILLKHAHFSMDLSTKTITPTNHNTKKKKNINREKLVTIWMFNYSLKNTRIKLYIQFSVAICPHFLCIFYYYCYNLDKMRCIFFCSYSSSSVCLVFQLLPFFKLDASKRRSTEKIMENKCP